MTNSEGKFVTSPHRGRGLFPAPLQSLLRALGLGTMVGFCLMVPVASAADLTIGFVGDLSGVRANIAQDQLDGFKLGIKHLGARLGGNEFSLVVADAHRDPRIGRQAVERMQQTERVEIILVSVDAAVVPALLPPAVAGKTLLIGLSPPPPALAGKDCSSSFFSLSGLTETLHDLAGQFLQQRGYKSIVLVGPDTASARAAAEAVRRGFKGQVTKVVSRRGEMDFTRDLRSIREAAPDAVYLLETGGMAVNFIRQMADQPGWDHPPLFGPGTTFDQALLAASGAAALDAASVAPWSEDFDIPLSRRVMADFESDYGRPVSLYAMIGYDGAMLLDAALRVEKKFNDVDLLRAALRRAEFPSTRGAVHFDSNQFVIQTYVMRQVIRDSRDRLVNEQRGILQKDLRDGHAGECPIRWTPEPAAKG